MNLTFVLVIIMTTSCTKAQTESPQATPQISSPKESITIGKRIKIYSEVLGEEKELYISLPTKYDEHVQSYPVVFTLEAEYLFEATNTITNYMAARSKMPSSIVVGLTNGEFDKRQEVGYKRWGGIPDKYLEFFKTELIPYIEKQYRANSHRTIVGLSPSTGFLYEAFITEPDIFTGYIALSAHLEWYRTEGMTLIDELLAQSSLPNQPKSTFYLGRSESDLLDHESVKDAFDDAINKLEKHNGNNVLLKIDVLKNEEHYLMALVGLRAGFATIHPNDIWNNPGWRGWDKNADYAQTKYKDYYDELSAVYGFDIYPIEQAHGYGFSITGHVSSAKRFGTNKQVIDLAELAISYYPNSANLHMLLAEAYRERGASDLAIKMGEKAVQLATKYHADKLTYYHDKIEMLKN